MDSPTDIITKFDLIIKSITDPLVQAIDDMIWVVTMLGEHGLIGMVSNLIQATVEIDAGVKSMVEESSNFCSLIAGYTVCTVFLQFLVHVLHCLLIHVVEFGFESNAVSKAVLGWTIHTVCCVWL